MIVYQSLSTAVVSTKPKPDAIPVIADPPHRARCIAVANSKGGVGKTTSVLNLAGALRHRGRRVLVCDMDPQANLSVSLGCKAKLPSLYELFRDEATLPEITIHTSSGIHLLPARPELSKSEIELAGQVGGEFKLQDALLECDTAAYDYILIDCPPNLGMLTINALVAAKEVFIPLAMEFLPLEGMAELVRTIEAIQKRYNRELKLTGIIPTFYSDRKRINKEVLQQVKQYFPDRVFNTRIRDNVHLKEAPSHAMTIFEYRPDSPGASDYAALSAEVLEMSQ